MWVNLSPGDGVIVGPSSIDANQNNIFTVDFNEDMELNIMIMWTIQPRITAVNLATFN
jgi:hypothetical protein